MNILQGNLFKPCFKIPISFQYMLDLDSLCEFADKHTYNLMSYNFVVES